ncbi:MAG: Crp/Fnr family transcriptional regulator [Bdellovibrionaceae bacterium]|nr:Crp/Fnr family transcriptional regulator [Bdellovibrio sp.]
MNAATIDLAYKSFYQAIHRHCAPPESEWLFYKENMVPRTFKKGDFFLKPGQPSNIYAFIYSGIMKQYFVTVDGKEFITRFDCPLETSGDAATLWQNKPARQYIEAITDVEALVSTPNFLQKLYAHHPVWNEGGRSLAEFRFFEKCDREFELLSYDAQTRYDLFLKRYGLNSAKISQKDMASYIGVTPSSLNKIIKTN